MRNKAANVKCRNTSYTNSHFEI